MAAFEFRPRRRPESSRWPDPPSSGRSHGVSGTPPLGWAGAAEGYGLADSGLTRGPPQTPEGYPAAATPRDRTVATLCSRPSPTGPLPTLRSLPRGSTLPTGPYRPPQGSARCGPVVPAASGWRLASRVKEIEVGTEVSVLGQSEGEGGWSYIFKTLSSVTERKTQICLSTSYSIARGICTTAALCIRPVLGRGNLATPKLLQARRSPSRSQRAGSDAAAAAPPPPPRLG
jgi:hypothetical protein